MVARGSRLRPTACYFVALCHVSHVQRSPIAIASPMTRLIVTALCLITFALNGCDNRTRDAARWDQIADTLKTDKNAQPWPEADSPWENAEHHTGTAW